MSDKMFHEVPLKGKKKYCFGDWKEYAVHDENNIKGFFGRYRFLSNFFPSKIWIEGLEYPSTECAYQALKVDYRVRKPFTTMKDEVSKYAWKEVPDELVLPDWDNRKVDVMKNVIFQKFLRHKDLREKLLNTGDKYLEEINHWADVFWGVYYVDGKGENMLGKILMKTRKSFQN